MGRVAADATAFGHRNAPFLIDPERMVVVAGECNGMIRGRGVQRSAGGKPSAGPQVGVSLAAAHPLARADALRRLGL
jgi:hypothetical protein